MLKKLKEKGANLNAIDKDGNNALHNACFFSNSPETVKWLIDTCAISIESKGQYQKTPFICAAQKGQLAVLKKLKEKGANLNAIDKDGNNALHNACFFSNSPETVKWLIDTCAISIESKGQHKRTPFICAAQKGQLAVLKKLKEKGANLKAIDKDGDNALHYACLSSNSPETVKWLIETCAISIESKGQYQKTPFLCAAEKGQLSVLKKLKEKGANLNAIDQYGNNALHYACLYSNSPETVEWLIDTCAISIESKGGYQKTPFLCAAQKGQLAVLKKLKEKGANLKAIDKDGDNALHYASLFSNSPETAKWLIDTCAILIESRGGYQKTPFLCAAEKGQLAVLKKLKEKGAKMDAKSNFGYCALYFACKYSNSPDAVEWLIKNTTLPVKNGFFSWITSDNKAIQKLLNDADKIRASTNSMNRPNFLYDLFQQATS